MATLFVAPTANFIQTTLNGAITNAATTITLNSTANMQAPGYVVIDRTDSNGVATAAAREVVSYTGVSGNNLTGCVRGADNSTARSHADGAVVETLPTVGLFNSLATIVASGLDTQGLLNAITSPVSIAQIFGVTNLLNTSISSVARGEFGMLVVAPSNASISQAFIGTRLDASAASITGFPTTGLFMGPGLYSGPTLSIGGLAITNRPYTIQWVSAVTRYVASGTSVGFNVTLRGASIFANATTRPAITAAGTFVSTASIATVNVNRGDTLTADVDSLLSGAGAIQEVTVAVGLV